MKDYLIKFKEDANKVYELLSEMLECWEEDNMEDDFINSNLVDEYPFDKSFDELLCDISGWIYDINEKIK